jgi:Mrp family chromosome partitioning ATPase
MLEVKKDQQTTTPAHTEAWPASLYARPRIPAMASPLVGSLVAEDIMDACRSAMQQFGIEGLTSIGITSSLRGEGRTTLAIAVALVLAEYGLDTTLVELDFDQPALANRLAVSASPGLGELSEGRATLGEAVRPISAGLSVITAGRIQGSVPRALSQLAKTNLLAEMAAQGQVVVADLPPLLGNSIGRQAAAMLADLVLVVRAGVVPAASILEAVAGLPVTPKVLVNGTHTHVPSWALRLSGI